MPRSIRYEDLLLKLEPAAGESYRVHLLSSPYGTATGSFRLPYDRSELPALAEELEQAVYWSASAGSDSSFLANPVSVPEFSPELLGNQLFTALFQGPIKDVFLRSLDWVRTREHTGLRIRIALDASDVALLPLCSLPWELLYRAETRDYLSRNITLSIVRHLEVVQATQPIALADSLRILLVSASPRGRDPLDLEEEMGQIRNACATNDAIHIDVLQHATIAKLRWKLRNESYQVLHFMGHGDFDERSAEGVLLFEDDAGGRHPVSGTVLADSLKGADQLRLVLLNACKTAQLARHEGQDPFTGVAPALIMAGLSAVVAMQFPISDNAALHLSATLYQALAEGDPIDAAVAEGRLAILQQYPHSWEWATPALFMNGTDGRLFDAASSSSRQKPADSPVRLWSRELDESKHPASEASPMRDKYHFGSFNGAGKVAVGDNATVHGDTHTHHHQGPLPSEALPDEAKYYYDLGSKALRARSYDQAAEAFKQTIAKAPSSADVHYHLALALLRGRRPKILRPSECKEIEEHLAIALDLDEKNAVVPLLLSFIKYDFYVLNGMGNRSPTYAELLGMAVQRGLRRDDLPEIERHLQPIKAYIDKHS